MNQKTGARHGNPNVVYYALAATEYGKAGSSTCNSTLGNKTGSGCIFHDVTLGDNDAPCTGSISCYLDGGKIGVLSKSDSSYQPAFAATTGWDFSTGIGTINVDNLINAW